MTDSWNAMPVMGRETGDTSGWEPSIMEDSYNGKTVISLKTKHFSDRKLFLTGEVTDTMANHFVSEILFLSQKEEDVNIYINSPGGLVSAGLVIYDTIQSCRNKMIINMYCIGLAASMAAVILAGGQNGRRFILPHSRVMIHEPLISGGMGGSATSIKKQADSILETKAITNRILAKHTGKTVEEIDKATAFDNFMNAQDAIHFGICDEIRNII